MILLVITLGIFVVLSTYLTLWGPFPALVPLGASTAYRNIYLHVPMAMLSVYLFTAALAVSIIYLLRANVRVMRWLDSLIIVGMLYSWSAFVTGTIWSIESWGSAWSWDPRQLGLLVVSILYTAYPAIRGSISDVERSRRIGAVYSVAAYASVPITLMAPSIFPSLHPSVGEALKELAANIAGYMYINLAVLSVITYLVMSIMARGYGTSRWLPLMVVALFVAIGTYLLIPYFAGDAFRVIDVSTLGVGILVTLSNGQSISTSCVNLSPLEVDGQPTLLHQLVTINGGCVFVINHWSVGINMIVVGITISIALLFMNKGLTRIYGDPYD